MSDPIFLPPKADPNIAFNPHPYKNTGPEIETSPNPSLVSALAGTGLSLGINAGVEKLFPDLSPTLRTPISIGSIYSSHYLLGKIGVYPKLSLLELMSSFPRVLGLGFFSSIALDGVSQLTGIHSFRFGQTGNTIGSNLFTLGLYYTFASSAKLSPIVTTPMISSGGSLIGLAPKGMAGGAGVAGGVGQAMNAAAPFLIGNMVTGIGKEAVFHFGGYDKDPDSRLDKRVYDIELQQISVGASQALFGKSAGGYVGALLDGLLGHLEDGILTGAEIFSEDVAKGRQIARQRIKDEMIGNSKSWGKVAKEHLISILLESSSETEGIRWSEVEKKISDLYQNPQNKLAIQAVYDTLTLTGHIATEAQEIKDIISLDGNLLNRKTLLDLIIRDLKKSFDQNSEELSKRCIVSGIEKNGKILDEDLLTPKQ
ncbi:MAG: hypothetical protein JNK65_03485, partial [Deltaproteobacteria bacterium]|nr:hypothetical protein [Deltaproteobacteria bacterium]